MRAPPAAARIFLCAAPADLRQSFDGRRGLVHAALGLDPLSGHWFAFRNRRGDRLKILAWDGDGWALWYKRLERGTFHFPDAGGAPAREVRPAELTLLLDGVVLENVQRRRRYRRPLPA